MNFYHDSSYQSTTDKVWLLSLNDFNVLTGSPSGTTIGCILDDPILTPTSNYDIWFLRDYGNGIYNTAMDGCGNDTMAIVAGMQIKL